MAIAPTPRPPGRSTAGTQIRQPKPSRLIEYFVALEIICQLALLSPTLAPFRVFFRTAVFGVSLMLLFVLPGHGKHHPAAKAALFVIVVLGVSMLNPGVNSETSAAAQVALYLAIL